MTVLFDAERYKYSGLKYLYECGDLPPNYPVPALREVPECFGLKGCCAQIGATWIDWSRGELEFY